MNVYGVIRAHVRMLRYDLRREPSHVCIETGEIIIPDGSEAARLPVRFHHRQSSLASFQLGAVLPLPRKTTLRKFRIVL
ncbi:MAG: hypothetical protein AVO35_11355 [Candidatus Aegiribacteria sp. MLS_C]|nr:MAG: hypothetical protein AVO35_11355 [Candidatus Aegiribacteria sp. MLS_C]